MSKPKEKRMESLDFEIQFFEGVVKRSPEYIDALVPLAEAYTRKGLYEKGLEIDMRLSRLCKSDPIVYYNLACSLALVGKKREAVKALKQAIDLGYDDLTHLRKDADLKCLQGMPAFEKLLKA